MHEGEQEGENQFYKEKVENMLGLLFSNAMNVTPTMFSSDPRV